MPAGFHTFSIGFYVLGSSEEPMQTSLCNSHTFGQRQEMIRKCLEDCVGTTQSRVGQVTAENKSRARGLAGTKLCCFLQLIKRQAGNTSKEIASLWIQGRSPPRHQGERNSLLRKEKWLSRTGIGGGTCFYRTHSSQQAPFSQGSLFLKLPSWSGFRLVWRSSNLTANFSRLEKQLTWASELWGKLAKPPNLFLLLNNISLTAKAVK